MELKKIAPFFTAIPTLCLALSIAYLAHELGHFAKLVPDIMEFLEFNKGELVAITEEVREVRKLVPSVLDEVREVRLLVPGVVREVSKISSYAPEAMKTINQTSRVVSSTTAEVARVRKMLPDILDESEKIRIAVPVYLATTQNIMGEARLAINDAQTIGKNAGTNVITGLVTAPFRLISSAGTGFADLFKENNIHLTDAEKASIESTSREVVASSQVGFSRSWEDKKTKRSGTLQLKSIDPVQNCKVVSFNLHQPQKKDVYKESVLCRDSKGEWVHRP